MTVQVLNFNKSKPVLAAALKEDSTKVRFVDPTPFGDRHFTGADIAPGTKVTVVMDHPTRHRFAIVVHSPKVGFRVM